MVWRIILWFFLVLAAVLILAFLLPVGIRVRYRNDELKLWYTVGPLRLLHRPEDSENRKKRKESKINIRKVFREPMKANQKYDNILGGMVWNQQKM